MRLLSTLNHHKKLMRMQNSASHTVCCEKFSFIILSVASSAHPCLYPRQVLLLPCRSVFGVSQTQRAQIPSQNPVPEPVWMQVALSTLVVPNVLVKSCLLSFVLKKKEMERENKITPCYSSLEEARRKGVFANICIFLTMGGTLMIKSVGWEQRTGSAEQTL